VYENKTNRKRFIVNKGLKCKDLTEEFLRYEYELNKEVLKKDE
jgi:hypothetical protein